MGMILKAAPIRERRIAQFKKRCRKLAHRGIVPSMKVLLVGEHPPSVIYTNRKKQFIESWGGSCHIVALPENISEEHFLAELKAVSECASVHGLFVQLPLPAHLQHLDVGQYIPHYKDVDGFHQSNLYHLLKGDLTAKGLFPCTPQGIITLLQEYGFEIRGKNILVIGRSLIVGRPLTLLFLAHNASVSLCHSFTRDLTQYSFPADIIVSAVGKERFFTRRFLHPERRDQILIDVGINRNSHGTLCGDMDFENLKDWCGAITPVPGGVGPMTILMLSENLLTASEWAVESKQGEGESS